MPFAATLSGNDTPRQRNGCCGICERVGEQGASNFSSALSDRTYWHPCCSNLADALFGWVPVTFAGAGKAVQGAGNSASGDGKSREGAGNF